MEAKLRFSVIGALIVSILLVGSEYLESAARNQRPSHVARRELVSGDSHEAAYRANNLGVALLEQYKPKEAAAAFNHALSIEPKLFIARVNLSIALYYIPDLEAALHEAQSASSQNPAAPQPIYLLGLIARAQNRFDVAISQFQKVQEIDPGDVGTNVNLGQLYVQLKKYAEATATFRKAIAAEPYNETALYNLGILLTRTGAKEEGQRLLERFQQYRQSGAGTTLGTNYLEQGRYAEALVSTGAEPELVDRTPPKVEFTDATASFFAPLRQTDKPQNTTASNRKWDEAAKNGFASLFKSRATLFDYDDDGYLDLLELTNDSLRLLRNEHGRFVDVTAQAGALNESDHADPILALAGDYDNDGRTDLLIVRYAEISLYHNDGKGKFSNHTREAGIFAYPYLCIAAAFVDFDHDGDLDVFIAGFADLSQTKFEPMLGMDSPLLQGGPGILSSDLFEVVQKMPGAPNLLLRNNGNGRFADVTAQAKVGGSLNHAVAVVPTDFDNRRDVDLLVVNYGSAVDLFSNQRDGSFRNVAKEVGLAAADKWSCVAAGDVNKDGFTDFFLGTRIGSKEPNVANRVGDGGTFAISSRGQQFVLKAAPLNPAKVDAAQFFDFDNDGLVDCLVLTDSDLQILRNTGDSWMNVTNTASSRLAKNVFESRTFAAADLDHDGDVDLLVGGNRGELHVLRNDGGNRNHSVRVKLHGRVSNKSAVQAKIEMRSGSLWQKLETYAVTPAPAPADVVFGLGKREKPDAVRVIWPAGIVQAETEFKAGPPAQVAISRDLNITELDRKPSSCPYLYTWNGKRFEFVSDFLGGGEMGYLEEPGRYNRPDPEEYVRIREDQLREQNGRFEFRVTNELEEALFLDRLQLLAIAHPASTEVYPNEGMTDPPKPFRLFITHNARPPLTAHDEHGHDMLDRITRIDRRYPDDFQLDRIRGYAAEHTLTMKLAEVQSPTFNVQSPKSKVQRLTSDVQRPTSKVQRPTVEHLSYVEKTLDIGHWTLDSSKTLDIGHWTLDTSNWTLDTSNWTLDTSNRVLLLLTGWTDYAWSSDNVAASQTGKAMKPPSLQVKDKEGNWRTVIEDIGIPVGRPQTVTVDLSGKFLSASREVRVVTNMRIYWDQILVDTSDGNSPTQITQLDPANASLSWRGFSRELSADGREPFGYDYNRVSLTSPWKVMTGRYTREGDVKELLLKSDDIFVISRPGDEISVSFNANELPPLPAGWKRTFLLHADGFSKEMDLNSASPDLVGPLPFHGMSRYPYSWPETYPLTEERRAYQQEYNTRIITSPVPQLLVSGSID